MESRWYLLPGQTLANTRISDRSHALHITETEWNKIVGHLDRKRIIAETAEKERAHKEALKKGSDEMTKNWPDSIEHVHQHKHQERKKRAEELERKRMENFNELRKEQEEIKDEFIKKVKKSLLYEKSYPRALNGALVLSEVLYEREKQKEFKKLIDQHYEEEEAKYAEKVRKDAEDEKREKEEAAKKIREKQMEFAAINKQTLKEKEEADRLISEMTIKQEAADNEHAQRELELQEQIKLEDMLALRAYRKKELKDSMGVASEMKKNRIKEEEEVDEVIEVVKNAKDRMACLEKARRKELLEIQIKRRQKASEQATAAAIVRDEAYLASINKAREEAEAKEDQKQKEKLEKEARMTKEREDARKEHLELEAERQRIDAEEKKWEMLNRLKQNDEMKAYDERVAEERWARALEYRKELQQQIEDARNSGERSKAGEQALVDEYNARKIKEADDEFFAYAEELLKHVRENGRSEYPILKVIAEYKKEMRLEDPNRKETVCRMPDGTVRHGNVRMVNVTPGKMAHHPREDPNYRRCRCHKEKVIR